MRCKVINETVNVVHGRADCMALWEGVDGFDVIVTLL